MVDLNHSHETFNIWWLIPLKPCQMHWGRDLLYHVPHHIIFLLVIMFYTSGLSMCMPSLLENPFTFFTNTHHPLQCYHLSFSTKNDCIFPCNAVVNLMWVPIYQFATWSLSQSRNIHIYFSFYSFHSTLISTSLFNSVCHTASCWHWHESKFYAKSVTNCCTFPFGIWVDPLWCVPSLFRSLFCC
jgi:hypothetical protein